jgi:GNAT superfamily N-acetyltransferase
MPIAIRPMTPDDVPAAADALRRGDWGERTSWFTFATSHPGCDAIVAVDSDGLIGTGVGTRNGAVGWVGTIYVVPERRGEGIGHELSRVVADRLEAAGCRTLVLAATPDGRRVYERLGFEVTDAYVVMEHAGSSARAEGGAPDPGVRPFAHGDRDEALALDRAATGEDRSAVLTAMIGVPGGLAVRDGDDPLRGFLLRAPWPGGATIAPEVEDARRLARARLRAHAGGRLITGLLASNGIGLERFAADGWTEIHRVVRMERGEALDWRSDWIWGQLNFALG